MKTILSLISIAAASFLGASPLAAQSATTKPAAAKRGQDTAPVSPDAKEKAEDAALLQQLDATGQDLGNGPRHPQNQWIPGRAAAAAGGMAGVPPGGVTYRLQDVVTRQRGGGAKPLLVRTSEPEPKAQAALEEDLSVMAHIFDKAINELPGGQRHSMTALGIDVFSWSGSAPMRSLYLDGYGAVFFLGVSFPLVPPAEKHEEEKPAGDSAWEDARQELYGQRLQGPAVGEPVEEYSQEKVDKLKESLLATLKNASNIRDLKPDESVTLWVSGGASGGAGRARLVKHNPRVTQNGDALMVEQLAAPARRRTILTIRANKADIDAYAKGKLSPEEFEKHARITTYTGDANGGAADGLVVGGFGGGGKTRF